MSTGQGYFAGLGAHRAPYDKATAASETVSYPVSTVVWSPRFGPAEIGATRQSERIPGVPDSAKSRRRPPAARPAASLRDGRTQATSSWSDVMGQ